MIVLLAGLESNSASDADRYTFTKKAVFPPMEFAVVSYSRQDFAKFKQHASQHPSVKDWEGEDNFTVRQVGFTLEECLAHQRGISGSFAMTVGPLGDR